MSLLPTAKRSISRSETPCFSSVFMSETSAFVKRGVNVISALDGLFLGFRVVLERRSWSLDANIGGALTI